MEVKMSNALMLASFLEDELCWTVYEREYACTKKSCGRLQGPGKFCSQCGSPVKERKGVVKFVNRQILYALKYAMGEWDKETARAAVESACQD